MLEIKEQKIDLTNVKHLHQSEFIYIVHHYNVWRLGPEIRKRLVDFIKYKSLEFINIANEDLKLFADLLNQRKDGKSINDHRSAKTDRNDNDGVCEVLNDT